MAVPLNSLFEVRLKYLANGQQCMNVFHYRNTAALPDPIDPRDVCVGLLEEYGGNGNGEIPGEFMKVFCTATTINSMQAQAVYPVRWRSSELTLSFDGLRPGELRAQNVQWTATKHGDFASRHDLGAIHVGGVGDTDYEAGEITAAFKIVANTFVTFLSLPLVLTDPVCTLDPCIANKAPVPNTDPVKYVYSGSVPISEWVRRDTIRTMRPRTKGVGI